MQLYAAQCKVEKVEKSFFKVEKKLIKIFKKISKIKFYGLPSWCWDVPRGGSPAERSRELAKYILVMRYIIHACLG